MSGRLRHAGWALGLMVAAVACNDILGLDELPRSEPFAYAEVKCAQCVQTKCSSEEQACAADLDCRELHDCRARCGLDDIACRYACEEDWPNAVDLSVSVALDTCRRAGCPDQCFGDGGLNRGIFEDAECLDCLDTKCADKASACIADANCERAFACGADPPPCTHPECITSCYYGAGQATAREAANSVENCWSEQCASECSVGRNWDCADSYRWGSSELDTLEHRLSIDYVGADTVKAPAEGLDVEICTIADCRSAGSVDDTGRISLELVVPPSRRWQGHLRFDGTLAATGAPIAPYLFYFGRPLTRSEDGVGLILLAQDQLELAKIRLGVPDAPPSRGHVAAYVRDCLWQRAPGVELEFVGDGIVEGESVEFYTDEELVIVPSEDGETTDLTAGGGIVNVKPGKLTVRALVDGTEVGSQLVYVEAGSVTGAFIFPNEEL